MKKRLDGLMQAISSAQAADGSFVSTSVPAGETVAAGLGSREFRTTFIAGLIAGALAEVPEVKNVTDRAVDFLLKQASPAWSFNYWARDSDQAVSQPYPDDWDDTAVAMVAVSKLRPEVLTGQVMAQFVKLLTATESQEGGPYRTWMVAADAPEVWHDVDLAVNSNIAYLLKLHEVELPNLEVFATQMIASGELSSRYYPSAYPVVYFLSRWYQGPERARLASWVAGQSPENPLQMALLLSAGVNLGLESEMLEAWGAGLMKISEARLQEPYAFCLDPAVEGHPYVAGAGALTAALVLEALTKLEAAKSTPAAAQKDDQAEHIHTQSVEQAMKIFPDLPGVTAIGQRVLKNDPAQQITLLPYIFKKALGKHGRKFENARLIELGARSVLGWVAYTIYDDFLDNEGQPGMLPVANLAFRSLVLSLGHDPVPGLAPVAWRLFDRMEAANAWEVSSCRFDRQSELLFVSPPDYGDLGRLADRSCGHALGCVAMLMELGFGPESAEMQALDAFFQHFLIARQLNDEAHDWKSDLQNGHINAVGAMLLSDVQRRGRVLAPLYANLEQHFWEQTITDVCDLIDNHLLQARQALAACAPVANPAALEALLEPVAAATREARQEQTKTVEFLLEYER